MEHVLSGLQWETDCRYGDGNGSRSFKQQVDTKIVAHKLRSNLSWVKWWRVLEEILTSKPAFPLHVERKCERKGDFPIEVRKLVVQAVFSNGYWATVIEKVVATNI